MARCELKRFYHLFKNKKKFDLKKKKIVLGLCLVTAVNERSNLLNVILDFDKIPDSVYLHSEIANDTVRLTFQSR